MDMNKPRKRSFSSSGLAPAFAKESDKKQKKQKKRTLTGSNAGTEFANATALAQTSLARAKNSTKRKRRKEKTKSVLKGDGGASSATKSNDVKMPPSGNAQRAQEKAAASSNVRPVANGIGSSKNPKFVQQSKEENSGQGKVSELAVQQKHKAASYHKLHDQARPSVSDTAGQAKRPIKTESQKQKARNKKKKKNKKRKTESPSGPRDALDHREAVSISTSKRMPLVTTASEQGQVTSHEVDSHILHTASQDVSYVMDWDVIEHRAALKLATEEVSWRSLTTEQRREMEEQYIGRPVLSPRKQGPPKPTSREETCIATGDTASSSIDSDSSSSDDDSSSPEAESQARNSMQTHMVVDMIPGHTVVRQARPPVDSVGSMKKTTVSAEARKKDTLSGAPIESAKISTLADTELRFKRLSAAISRRRNEATSDESDSDDSTSDSSSDNDARLPKATIRGSIHESLVDHSTSAHRHEADQLLPDGIVPEARATLEIQEADNVESSNRSEGNDSDNSRRGRSKDLHLPDDLARAPKRSSGAPTMVSGSQSGVDGWEDARHVKMNGPRTGEANSKQSEDEQAREEDLIHDTTALHALHNGGVIHGKDDPSGPPYAESSPSSSSDVDDTSSSDTDTAKSSRDEADDNPVQTFTSKTLGQRSPVNSASTDVREDGAVCNPLQTTNEAIEEPEEPAGLCVITHEVEEVRSPSAPPAEESKSPSPSDADDPALGTSAHPSMAGLSDESDDTRSNVDLESEDLVPASERDTIELSSGKSSEDGEHGKDSNAEREDEEPIRVNGTAEQPSEMNGTSPQQSQATYASWMPTHPIQAPTDGPEMSASHGTDVPQAVAASGTQSRADNGLPAFASLEDAAKTDMPADSSREIHELDQSVLTSVFEDTRPLPEGENFEPSSKGTVAEEDLLTNNDSILHIQSELSSANTSAGHLNQVRLPTPPTLADAPPPDLGPSDSDTGTSEDEDEDDLYGPRGSTGIIHESSPHIIGGHFARASARKIDATQLSGKSPALGVKKLDSSQTTPPKFDDQQYSHLPPAIREAVLTALGKSPTSSVKKRKMTGNTSTHFSTPSKVKSGEGEHSELPPAKRIATGRAKKSDGLAASQPQADERIADSNADTRVEQVVESSGTPGSTRRKRSPAKKTGTVSEHFIEDRVDLYNSTAGKRRKVPAGQSANPFPPINQQFFGIIQEKLWREPFWLLVATVFLNQTTGRQAAPTFWKVKKRWPNPQDLADAEYDELFDVIKHLGLQHQRTRRLKTLAAAWHADPPQAGRRHRTLHYPSKGDGKQFKKDDVIEEDADDCAGALEIAHLPGCGPYSWDSWRIFCRDLLRGVAADYAGSDAKSSDLEPEWKRVLPGDKELRACLRWMWLKEGIVWSPLTGKKRDATEEEMEKARRGEVLLEDEAEAKFAAQAAGVDISSPEKATRGDGTLAESPVKKEAPSLQLMNVTAATQDIETGADWALKNSQAQTTDLEASSTEPEPKRKALRSRRKSAAKVDDAQEQPLQADLTPASAARKTRAEKREGSPLPDARKSKGSIAVKTKDVKEGDLSRTPKTRRQSARLLESTGLV